MFLPSSFKQAICAAARPPADGPWTGNSKPLAAIGESIGGEFGLKLMYAEKLCYQVIRYI